MQPLNMTRLEKFSLLLPLLMRRYSGTHATCALHDVGGLRTQRLPPEADDEKYGLLVSPDPAVQACMLSAVFASQRLHMFSTAMVQQCIGHEFLQRATSPLQSHNELQEPQTHAKTAVNEATSQATAASPTLQHAQMRTSTSATAAAEPAACKRASTQGRTVQTARL